VGNQWQAKGQLTFRYVQIEEIAIQNRLNDASDDCDQVIVTFCHISVDLGEEKEEKFVSEACSDGGKHVKVEITSNEVEEKEEKHVGNVGKLTENRGKFMLEWQFSIELEWKTF
jgi:hypothetical protein